MKLYNTLTRRVEPFKPQSQGRTTVYTCGPTVYDYPHIGNWFTYIREDILIRALLLDGQKPDWVMNITDVGHLVSDADEGEDKLEKGARREGKTAWQVAEFYTDYFLRSMAKLNILTPDHLTKATDHIQEQISLIKQLEEKGYTYIISDGVYYDTSKFPRYADFAQLDLDEQQAGARVEINPEKRNQTDFALWKFSPKDHRRDMEWDSPWSPPGTPDGVSTKGFPGWHIECSAMAMKYLGDTLDIHAGGIDHVPVHHTNEIAQSEAVTGKPFARFWFHSNHIMIEGDKISKSLGNSITLEDIEQAGFSLDAFRLLVLESHYRTQSHFSWETLDAALNRLKNWYAVAALKWQAIDADLGDTESDYAADEDIMPLFDDLGTPQVLANINQRFAAISERLASRAQHDNLVGYLETVDRALGTVLSRQPDITAEQKQTIRGREAARQAKDWEAADKLRNSLATQGIGVRDTPHGPIWYPL